MPQESSVKQLVQVPVNSQPVPSTTDEQFLPPAKQLMTPAEKLMSNDTQLLSPINQKENSCKQLVTDIVSMKNHQNVHHDVKAGSTNDSIMVSCDNGDSASFNKSRDVSNDVDSHQLVDCDMD